jgi:hypothetical protein
MLFHQTESRCIRARNQAMIREGGEQGRAAALRCFLAGATACGLSCPAMSKGSIFYDPPNFRKPYGYLRRDCSR